MKNDKIDIVVTWVDGNDPDWKKERANYKVQSGDEIGNNFNCYRDFDLMEYFFRGIEKNATWVNNIFFVTWGHLPKFLNVNHPKLKIIRHEDFIPTKYLPTFNSNVIELNLHRIKDLSENFVLFNDDMFLIDQTREEDFFYKNLPCDTLASRTMVNYVVGFTIYYIAFNNMGMINKYFYGNKYFDKWINPRYKLKDNITNAVNMLSRRYSAFENNHLPIAHKKSIFEEIWSKEYEALDHMCHNRFRSPYDYSHWLMRYWRFATGHFYPTDVTRLGFYTDISYDINYLIDIVENKKEKIFLLNDWDGETDEMFAIHKPKLQEAFNKILPEKSSFEI
jgi:hypothetical protein